MTTETAVRTWNIDAAHSIAEFAVRHMMVSTVKGRFGTLEGAIEGNEANPVASAVRATIDVASIDTRDEQRDAHLRSDDFFSAEKYPHITFVSKRVERVDAEQAARPEVHLAGMTEVGGEHAGGEALRVDLEVEPQLAPVAGRLDHGA